MATSVHSPDNILYTCKKLATLQNYKQLLCKWSGTLHQYIQHIASKHEQSYYILKGEMEKFEWRLPYLEDQIDIGIFKHKLGCFLYEIVYNKQEDSLCFAFVYLEKTALERNYYGKLILSDNNCKTILTCQVKTKPTETLKLIQEQSHIKITKDVLQKFVDQNCVLRWCIKIDDNDTEEDVDVTLTV